MFKIFGRIISTATTVLTAIIANQRQRIMGAVQETYEGVTLLEGFLGGDIPPFHSRTVNTKPQDDLLNF